MSKASLIAFLAAGVFLLPRSVLAESAEEKPLLDVLEAAIDAQLASDFSRLVSLVHPTTQHLFRDQLSARFDDLLRLYAFEQIVSVSGLPRHPKDLSLSDSEFFIFACNSASLRHPDFVGDPKYLPFNIDGSIFDNDELVRVVLSYAGAVHTARTDYNYVQPFVIAFRQEQSSWLVWSCPLARRIGDDWSRDLARLVKTGQVPR